MLAPLDVATPAFDDWLVGESMCGTRAPPTDYGSSDSHRLGQG